MGLVAQPTIDGTFDGTATWGSSIASDGDGSWASVDLDELYVTFDDTYVYLGASFTTVADWQSWGFVLNTSSGGGSSEVWGYPITYGHSDLPDHVVKGHFGQGSGSYAELRAWNGSSWTLVSGGITSFSSDEGNAIVEVQVERSTLGSPLELDVQFYVTGNNAGEHGTFDAIPDDENASSWNVSSSPTTLDNYAASIPIVPTAQTAGNWTNSATWYRSVTPGTSSEVNIAANVTLDTDATISGLTISSGTFTASDGSARTLTIASSDAGTRNFIQLWYLGQWKRRQHGRIQRKPRFWRCHTPNLRYTGLAECDH